MVFSLSGAKGNVGNPTQQNTLPRAACSFLFWSIHGLACNTILQLHLRNKLDIANAQSMQTLMALYSTKTVAMCYLTHSAVATSAEKN